MPVMKERDLPVAVFLFAGFGGGRRSAALALLSRRHVVGCDQKTVGPLSMSATAVGIERGFQPGHAHFLRGSVIDLADLA